MKVWGIFIILLLGLSCCAFGADKDAKASSVQGPRLTNAELLGMLNLSLPGLEKVKAAVGSGDMQGAKHELAEYLRHREKPVWRFDWRARPKHDARPEGVDTSEADRILQRDLPSVGVRHKFDGEIDWTLDPINYKEWPWQLNRHPFWEDLGRAYWATGDEKYAREFVYQMTDWVKKCPVPLTMSKYQNDTQTWRTIEAGIRTTWSWPDSYLYFLTSPSFTDDAMITMVKSFVEHARHLMQWPTTGNWLTMECDGLMHIGVLFPEFKDSAEWRKTAVDRLYTELDKQVYPDGAQIELSTGYHQVSLINFQTAWETARMNGYPMPADYISKMQRMFEYDMKIAMPDGTCPGLNDGNRGNMRGYLRTAYGYFPERKDYQWFGTAGKEGTKPDFTSVAMPFAGHLVMRSSWEPDARYLMFDAGPFGYGHQHEDALSFVIFAYGKYMLVDPGNYPYDSSDWRKYVLSTRAHNTIMVDGQEQHRRDRPREEYVLSKPMHIKWASNAKLDYAVGTYEDGYGRDNSIKVTHKRSVFFVKPEYWIVVDMLTPSDDKVHKYESAFHLDMSGADVDALNKSVRTTDENGANLSILPLEDDGLKVRIVSGQKEPIVQGWMPVTGYDCRPIPTPVFEKEQSGKATMAYVFYPTPEGGKCPVVKVKSIDTQGADGAVGLAIEFEKGRVDYFVQCEKSADKVKFGPFESTGIVTYIRTDNGHVVNSAVADAAIEDLSETDVRHKF